MLEKVKQHLRISHNKLDEDIFSVTNECLSDLRRVGVEKLDTEDDLIVAAVKLYTRYRFNFENQGERYRLAYETLRNALSLAGDYHDE